MYAGFVRRILRRVDEQNPPHIPHRRRTPSEALLEDLNMEMIHSTDLTEPMGGSAPSDGRASSGKTVTTRGRVREVLIERFLDSLHCTSSAQNTQNQRVNEGPGNESTLACRLIPDTCERASDPTLEEQWISQWTQAPEKQLSKGDPCTTVHHNARGRRRGITSSSSTIRGQDPIDCWCPPVPQHNSIAFIGHGVQGSWVKVVRGLAVSAGQVRDDPPDHVK